MKFPPPPLPSFTVYSRRPLRGPEETFEDPKFARSGLVFAVGPRADGTSEMVAAEVKAICEQFGAACIGISEAVMMR
jgi:hypothetical protein